MRWGAAFGRSLLRHGVNGRNTSCLNNHQTGTPRLKATGRHPSRSGSQAFVGQLEDDRGVGRGLRGVSWLCRYTIDKAILSKRYNVPSLHRDISDILRALYVYHRRIATVYYPVLAVKDYPASTSHG